eukprot:10477975-Alexandrium_andersonii.AAC.1
MAPEAGGARCCATSCPLWRARPRALAALAPRPAEAGGRSWPQTRCVPGETRRPRARQRRGST